MDRYSFHFNQLNQARFENILKPVAHQKEKNKKIVLILFLLLPHLSDRQILPILCAMDPEDLLNCGRASNRLRQLVSDREV